MSPMPFPGLPVVVNDGAKTYTSGFDPLSQTMTIYW